MASLILATMSVKSLEYIFVDIFFFSNLFFSPGVHGATEGVPGNGGLVRGEVGHQALRAGRHRPAHGLSHLPPFWSSFLRIFLIFWALF